jgi:hypothetical protein
MPRIFRLLIQFIFSPFIKLISLIFSKKPDGPLRTMTKFAIGFSLSLAVAVSLSFVLNIDFSGWFDFSKPTITIDNSKTEINNSSTQIDNSSTKIDNSSTSTTTTTINNSVNSSGSNTRTDITITPNPGNPPSSGPQSFVPSSQIIVVPGTNEFSSSSSSLGLGFGSIGSPQNGNGQSFSAQSELSKGWDSVDRDPSDRQDSKISSDDRDRSSSPPLPQANTSKEDSWSMPSEPIHIFVPEPSYEVAGIAIPALMILFAWRSRN